MALVAGSVSVDSAEVVTGTGLARAMFDQDVATLALPAVPTLGSTTAPYSVGRPVNSTDIDSAKMQRVSALQERGRLATAYATGIVTYFHANAVAHVTSQSLGKTPNPNDPASPIDPPASPVDIPIL